jgi:hypothetical protein
MRSYGHRRQRGTRAVKKIFPVLETKRPDLGLVSAQVIPRSRRPLRLGT